MRKSRQGMIGAIAALFLILATGASAQAADNVKGYRCYSSASSMGTICISAYFSNTNCNANTLTGCSGLNGAKLDSVEITTTSGALHASELLFKFDVYGDSTTAYNPNILYLPAAAAGTRKWVVNMPPNLRADINRVCVNFTGTNVSDNYYSIGGMNPYGISQTGSCDFD